MHWSSEKLLGVEGHMNILCRFLFPGEALLSESFYFFQGRLPGAKKKNRQIFTEIRRGILQAKTFNRTLHPLLHVHPYVCARRQRLKNCRFDWAGVIGTRRWPQSVRPTVDWEILAIKAVRSGSEWEVLLKLPSPAKKALHRLVIFSFCIKV